MDILEPPRPPDAELPEPRQKRAPRKRHPAAKIQAIADALLSGQALEAVAEAQGVNLRAVYMVRSGDHPTLTLGRRQALRQMFGVPRRRRTAKQRRKEGMIEQAIAAQGEGAVRQGMLTMLTDLRAEVSRMMREMAALQELMRAAELERASLGLKPSARNSDGRPWWAFWRRR